MPEKKYIFLDRDGVINKEIGYLHKISDLQFVDGIFEPLKYLVNDLKYNLIIVTNQSGINRGMYTLNEYEKFTHEMMSRLSKKGVEIKDIFFCPHIDSDNCDCRKPKPGMFFKAQEKYKVDLSKSWMVGDKESDITAANKAGIKKTIMVRSGHSFEERLTNAKYIIDSLKEIKSVIDS